MSGRRLPLLNCRAGTAAAVVLSLSVLSARAAWYWPFGSDDAEAPPRLSDLMEPASMAIDDAADRAAEGDVAGAVAGYRKALAELDRVEMENAERATTPEFASLRNKRAYVNAAIDSLLLAQARGNAKAVAVTDTTELERRVAEKRAASGRLAARQAEDAPAPRLESQAKAYMEGERNRAKVVERAAGAARASREAEKEIAELLRTNPGSRRARMMMAGEAMRRGDIKAAREKLAEVLSERPNNAPALNMRAVCEASEGDFKAAEGTLDQAIRSNPRDYRAYYNMASLVMQTTGNGNVARRYYETGRAVGGPRDRDLEGLFR